MKYRLKKDLPIFKAGLICETSQLGDLIALETVDGEALAGGYLLYESADLVIHPNILTDWFEEIRDEPKTVDDLKEGDRCYFINFNCTRCYVSETVFDEVSSVLREYKGLFLTKEDAEKELTRRKAQVILERDTKGFKPDWNNDSIKWEVVFEHSDIGYIGAGLLVNNVNHCQCHDLYFATKEDAQASIKAHEKEWKIYLGVEE